MPPRGAKHPPPKASTRPKKPPKKKAKKIPTVPKDPNKPKDPKDPKYPKDHKLSKSAGAARKYRAKMDVAIGVGKEGTTYRAFDSKNAVFAMKTFRKGISPSDIKREAGFQKAAHEAGVAPKVHQIGDTYIVMDMMKGHLVDSIREKKGYISVGTQKRIIDILRALDSIGVFHNDVNLLNFMHDGRKRVFLIDYGMAKKITKTLAKKLKTERPNTDLTLTAIVLKLKAAGCPLSSYNLLIDAMNPEHKQKFEIN